MSSNSNETLLESGEIHIQAATSSQCCAPAANANYVDMDEDEDAVIPELIARPLLYSSHLLLVTVILAAVYGYWILMGLTLFVYITSVAHWRKPRFSTIERKLDFTAVAANIIYGTIFSMSLKGMEYKVLT